MILPTNLIMKGRWPIRYFIGLLITLTFLLITQPTYASNVEEKTIEQYEEDVTGDGNKEIILLKGLPISDTSDFYQHVWVEIKNNQNQKWTIQYKGGYQPKLFLINLTGDNRKELLFQASSDVNEKNQNKYFLHTIEHNQVKQKKLPEQPYVRGKFLDNFFAEIQFSPEDETKTVNLQGRASQYIDEGLYSKSGQLLKNKMPTFNPISFIEPVIIHETNRHGLKSLQYVTDSVTSNPIGSIETVWVFNQGNWIILNTKWVPN